jgi:alpha-D-xyloside xylohydrolase
MKFTNGYWLTKEGIEPHFAAAVHEAEQQGDELVVYAPEKPINVRGATLGNLLLAIRYSSPMENVIKVRISHFEGGVDRGPHFPLEQFGCTAFKPSIRITPESVVLESGGI